jgi:hypothetical protein
MEEVPIEDVPGWSAGQIARAKRAWLTTAQQIVAVSNAPGGMRSLAGQLNIDEEDLAPLVEAARKSFSSEKAAAIDNSPDSEEFGLGATTPPNDP